MLKPIAVVFGVAFIVIGILGFVPAVTPNGLLLGVLTIDPIHNSLHLLTGVIALVVSVKESYTKLFFQFLGVIYAFMAIFGYMLEGNLILMHTNIADNWLHAVIAIIALYLGFIKKPKPLSA